MCADRIDEGLKPRCVESCPTGAIEFGEIEDLRQKHITNWALLENVMGFLIIPSVILILSLLVWRINHA